LTEAELTEVMIHLAFYAGTVIDSIIVEIQRRVKPLQGVSGSVLTACELGLSRNRRGCGRGASR
jgi:hypothetical protein